MISRVAEHCFWMSRYLERAENIARTLDVNQTLLLDFDVPTEHQWKPLLIISGIHDFADSSNAEAVQNHLTWEPENPCSIFASLGYARENARIIREVISADMWERLNYFYLWINSADAREQYEADRNGFSPLPPGVSSMSASRAAGNSGLAPGSRTSFLPGQEKAIASTPI